MNLLVLNSADIEKLIDLDELRLSMREVFLSVSNKETRSELRHVSKLNEMNVLGIMPAINHTRHLVGYKAVTVYPQNSDKRMNPHQGIVALLDYETGRIKCLLEGSTLTAIRTAAASAFATDFLCKKNSESLAIIGAGRQAYEHYRSISKIRNLKSIKIYNRTKERASQLAELIARESQSFIQVLECPIEAVRDADIVVTCTASRIPFFSTSDLKAGTHLNAIGACRPGFHEVEVLNHDSLKIFVDQFEACREEADEINKIGKDISQTTSEIGQVLNGTRAGRKNDQEITFFKSVGIAAEDILTGELIYQKAFNKKMGTTLQFN